MPEDIALFIDFENIRYSMLNIQRREPDPQELIAVARRYGTVMVARAYADWSRQPEPFKGSLTAAMIDRVDCPAKQRDRIRMGTVNYGNTPTSALGSPGSSQKVLLVIRLLLVHWRSHGPLVFLVILVLYPRLLHRV